MSKNQRKAFYMVLSVLISVLLWLYVSVMEDPEGKTEVANIPVTFINEESLKSKNLSIITNETPTLRLTFSGKRSDLNKIDNENVTITVDLSQVMYPGQARCAYTVTLPDSVKNSVSTVGYSSMYATLFVDHEAFKIVEVRLKQDVGTKEDYMVDISVIEPAEVRLDGPESVLEKIEYAEATLNRENVDQSIDANLNYVLKDSDGNNVDSTNITLSTPTVRVTVPIRKTNEVALDVKIRDGGGITGADNVSYTITPPTIKISGDPATVDNLNIIELQSIDLSKIESNVTREYPIIIPNDCENLSGFSVATVEIEIFGAQKRQIKVTNIEAVNATLPDGYMINFFAKALSVTIRGPGNTVEAVNPDKVRAVVDLDGQTLQPSGQARYPVTIYIDDNEKVGAVGEYSTVLEIVPIPDEPDDAISTE